MGHSILLHLGDVDRIPSHMLSSLQGDAYTHAIPLQLHRVDDGLGGWHGGQESWGNIGTGHTGRHRTFEHKGMKKPPEEWKMRKEEGENKEKSRERKRKQVNITSVFK